MTSPNIGTTRASILLVEDNEMIRALIVDVLELEYDLETFGNAESALVRAKEESFDVVLLDITLPTMGGMEAVKHFRKLPRYEHTPIVAMTGHTSPEQRKQYLQAGFTDHLGKPFMPEELMDLLSRLAPQT
jgi:CheY-like chemotaxis protein